MHCLLVLQYPVSCVQVLSTECCSQTLSAVHRLETFSVDFESFPLLCHKPRHPEDSCVYANRPCSPYENDDKVCR